MNDRPGPPYSRDELDVVTRIAIVRAMVRVTDICNEFRSREMGHVDAETLIGQMQDRLVEEFRMMRPALRPSPEVRHSGK